MAVYSIFQDAALDAFTAPTSARDVGQEMLHATLLLSCAFVGWCASSALISTLGWFQKCPEEGKCKEGSGIFREEIVAYVRANTIEDASKHYGLSHAEIRNCIDTVEQSQRQADQRKVSQIWQSLQENMLQKMTFLLPSLLSNGLTSQATEVVDCEPTEAHSEDEGDDDVCTLDFSSAPSFSPGLMLLEQYGVFGASTGVWCGSVEASPIPNDLLSGKVEDNSNPKLSSEPSTQTEAARMWVPLEYTW